MNSFKMLAQGRGLAQGKSRCLASVRLDLLFTVNFFFFQICGVAVQVYYRSLSRKLRQENHKLETKLLVLHSEKLSQKIFFAVTK